MVDVEKTLLHQSEILEKIKNISTNLKKDGPSRRNSEYLSLRLERLELCWEQFSLNHSSLMMSGADITGQYVTENVFEKVKELYTSTKNTILLFEQQQQKSSISPAAQQGETSGTQNNKQSEYLNEQYSNIRALERSINNLNIHNITEKWQLEDKLKTITSRWETYDALYWKLDTIVSNSEPYENEYNRLEIMFEQAKSSINRKIWSCVHQERSTPRIDLPTFDGGYSQWTTFKDLFTEAVHLNTLIPATQKMQHLKSKLRGEAERLVHHLQISSDNYESCWNILKHRYDNTRMLFTHQANLLLNQQPIQQPSASQLKKMHDITKESLNAISNLKIDITNWDPLIVHILLQKLDAETTESYINSLSNPRELPNLEAFLSFLEHKFMSLESTNKTVPNNQKNKRKITISNEIHNKQHAKTYNKQQATYHSSTRNCPKCKRDHGLYNCKEFLEMDSEMRLNTAIKLQVCQNCLFSHNGNECTSKQSKGYIIVFVCMVTKAVHLELVSDMTSETFIAALSRMIARRGIPKNMYSDNGTNFVGANRELKREFRLNSTFNTDVYNKLTELQIQWHFLAPIWPSAGGIWEAAVRSMKGHLKKVLGEQKLTFEQFSTLLAGVEACLNSRPLVPLTEDIEDLDFVLTPGHFLTGEPLLTRPREDLTQETCLKTRWQLTTKMLQDFWRKWSSQYLQQLQSRCKWQKEKENIAVGEIVIVKEDCLPPGRWALGRVEEVHPGEDSRVRVVSLKTKNGIFKRPVTKLIKLPVKIEEEQKTQLVCFAR